MIDLTSNYFIVKFCDYLYHLKEKEKYTYWSHISILLEPVVDVS